MSYQQIPLTAPTVTVNARTFCASIFVWQGIDGQYIFGGVYEQAADGWNGLSLAGAQPIVLYSDAELLLAVQTAGGIVKYVQAFAAQVNAFFQAQFGKTLPTAIAPLTGPDHEPVDGIEAMRQCQSLLASLGFSVVDGVPVLGAPKPKAVRIAVIGDSISARNKGRAMHAWPELLGSMIQSTGVFDVTVRNYSIGGLRWSSAHTRTPGWLIGGSVSPLDAVKRDGCDVLIVCLGVNDRGNPHALADAQAFSVALPDVPVVWVRQNMFDANGVNDAVVTQGEQQAMDAVYAALGGDGFSLGLGKLYDMGYTYDHLHPTNSGKQWIASTVHMWLERTLPLTPGALNIAWLYAQPPEVQEQMRRANQ